MTELDLIKQEAGINFVRQIKYPQGDGRETRSLASQIGSG